MGGIIPETLLGKGCCPCCKKRRPISRKVKRRLTISLIVLFCLLILLFLIAFVVFPLVVQNSIAVQRIIIFNNLFLHTEQDWFYGFEIVAGLRNLYVSVNDKSTNKTLSLGVWHLLPKALEDEALNGTVDFDNALRNSNHSVVIYFHGIGEDRSNRLNKFIMQRLLFHVIAFDYRDFGDSSKFDLSEDAVINDCVQLYEWLLTKTTAPIFIWGHSLGSALATRTAAEIKNYSRKPVGLILESAFTTMSEELYENPVGKIFSWLPWFEATVVQPLQNNGFIFNTVKHILSVDYPIMLMTAADDEVIPSRFTFTLYNLAVSRNGTTNATYYYKFPAYLGYNHNFIEDSPFVPFFVNYFVTKCLDFHANPTAVLPSSI